MIMLCDSQGLKDSLNSTKMVEEKMMRPTIQSLKDLITCRQIGEFRWVPTDLCLADVLTKKDAKMSGEMMEIVKRGELKEDGEILRNSGDFIKTKRGKENWGS